MQLKRFKTLWGNPLPIELACQQAVLAEFDGVEGQAPRSEQEVRRWGSALAVNGCDYIAEIVTGGGYVPQRNWSVKQHLDDLRLQIEHSLALEPLFATCLAGCDAWEESQSVDFYHAALEIGDEYDVTLSFETHRSRPTFNPWSTLRIAKALPQLKFTDDISHWCVVCERLMDSEMETLMPFIPQVHHLHARVGYDQGPQVPDPRAPEYQEAVRSHLNFWQQVWRHRQASGADYVTMTPEFGPDGYCHLQPYTQMPVVDLWDVNQWMGKTVQEAFSETFSTR